MPYRTENTTKAQTMDPFRDPKVERRIVVEAGALWPTGDPTDDVIPIGVPMSPVSGGSTGRYKPVRRSYLAAIHGTAATLVTVNETDGFAVGDFVAVYTTVSPTTNDYQATISAINRTTQVITLSTVSGATANTSSWIEVEENGYLLSTLGDAVFLGQNVETLDAQDNAVSVPAKGYRGGQIDVSRLTAISANCHDAMTELMIPDMDYVPVTPVV